MKRTIIKKIEKKVMGFSRNIIRVLIDWGVFNHLDSRFRRMINDYEFKHAIYKSIQKIFYTQPGTTKWIFENYPLELNVIPDYDEVEKIISMSDVNRFKTYFIETFFVRGDKQSKRELFYGTIVVDTLMNIAISRSEEKTLKNFERKYQT